MSDDIESISEGEGTEYSIDSDDQLQPDDTLVDRGVADVLDEGYSPPEKPSKTMRYGYTAEDQRDGESLDEHLAEETPDIAAQTSLHEDLSPRVPDNDDEITDAIDDIDYTDPQTGEARAGRLVSPDEGVNEHVTHQEIASDAGIDGAAASAEEAAVHTTPLDEKF